LLNFLKTNKNKSLEVLQKTEKLPTQQKQSEVHEFSWERDPERSINVPLLWPTLNNNNTVGPGQQIYF